MHTDDGHIVHECLSGNAEAFALLVDRYKTRIFVLVYAKIGHVQDAEDITQDAFLNAFRKLSTLRRWDNFYAWLYSIAMNRCKEFYRTQQRRIDTALQFTQSSNIQADMDTQSDRLRNQQLHEALASLPEMHRQVLMLRYMAGMKSKEIARALRVSPNTVNQRLMRARSKLKTVLSEEMVSILPTAFADTQLQPGFTPQVLELIKDAQIQMAPHKSALPLGLSAAGGVIILLLSLSVPRSPLRPLGEWLRGPLLTKTQVTEGGEIPVDDEATQVAVLANEDGDDTFGQKPKPIVEAALIPQSEDTAQPKTDIALTGIRLPEDFNISWDIDISPGGAEFIYVSGGYKPRSVQLVRLPVVAIDATAPMEGARHVVLEEGSEQVDYSEPKWSPDEKWIAFYREEYHEAPAYSAKNIDVYLIPASGGEMRFLAQADGMPETPSFARGLCWSPNSKELAFVKRQGKDSDIYIVSIEAGQVRPFTTDGKDNTDPSWSRDGKWISYSSRRGGWVVDTSYLWRQPVGGGKAVRANKEVHLLRPPVPSPDGRWAAYTHWLRDGRSGFLASSVTGAGEFTGEPMLLKSARLQSAARALRWNRDDTLIVLQYDYIEVTFVVSVGNGTQFRLSSNPDLPFEYAQWSSNGKTLFLTSTNQRRPAFLDIQTNQYTELPVPLPEEASFGESTISPDESQVAYVLYQFRNTNRTQFGAGGPPDLDAYLHTMPVAGGTSTPLARTGFFHVHPRWSPDGQEIAFIDSEIGEPGIAESKLCVVSVSTGEVKTLTDSELCMRHAWSPDGTMLAYLRLKRNGGGFDPDEMDGDIYVIPASGGTPKQITDTPEKEIKITWTPEGKRIAFEIHGEAWIASIDEGKARRLERGYIPLSWSSDGQSYLAFNDRGELRRVSLDGKTSTKLAVRVPNDARPLSRSPDGETILYQQTNGETQCWRIDTSHFASR